MKRTELKRRSPLARGVGIRRRNEARAKRLHDRNFGDEADAVRAMPCLITGGQAELAHVVSRGANGGRFDVIPLRPDLHREQHSIGVESFAAKYGLDLRLEADRIALEHAAPLGIRGLAARWASEQFVDAHYRGRAALVEQLDAYERDALFGWVRRWLARDAALGDSRTVVHDRDTGTCFLADKLGIGELMCRALIDAAGGWPEVRQ